MTTMIAQCQAERIVQLERERDEARALADKWSGFAAVLMAEREQLRTVSDNRISTARHVAGGGSKQMQKSKH